MFHSKCRELLWSWLVEQCDCVNEWCVSPGRIVKNSRVNVLTPESRFLFLLLLAYYFLLFFVLLLFFLLLPFQLLLLIFLHLFLPLLLILLILLLILLRLLLSLILLFLLRGEMEEKKISLTVHWHTDQNGKKKRKVLLLIWQLPLCRRVILLTWAPHSHHFGCFSNDCHSFFCFVFLSLFIHISFRFYICWSLLFCLKKQTLCLLFQLGWVANFNKNISE